MSEKTAQTAIRAKHQELKDKRMDLGTQLGPVQSGGSGGFFQTFADGNIYWHQSTGAHEVHGNILKRYLELGGPGANPHTGSRSFGYAIQDEDRTMFTIPISRFEFGDIYAVPGTGAVGVYGNLRSRVNGFSGAPLVEPQRIPQGEVQYCANSVLFLPKGAVSGIIEGGLFRPMLGRPGLTLPGNGQVLPLSVSYNVDDQSWEDLLALFPGQLTTKREQNSLALLAELWTDKLMLRSVKNKAQTFPVSVAVKDVTPISTGRSVKLTCTVGGGAAVPNRTLLSLCFRRPDGKLVEIAPHSIYARDEWERFGFIHATDIHVSARLESFRAKLRAAGRLASARQFVNTNDSFRALINYANRLHDLGIIDFVATTGDLVDYVFEAGDDREGPGNYRLFERILLGQAQPADADGVRNEELHAPIFTLLGNHDYVVNPYKLFFDVDIPVMKDKVIEKYSDFNLTKDDARALQGGSMPTVSDDAAADMTKSISAPNGFYRTRINSERSYVIKLGGKHRLIMLDTGRNADAIDGLGDALEEFLGFSNENEDSFVRGTPNSVGIDLSFFRQAVDAAPSDGVIIVGMHNPPLNPLGNEYPHFFRETERPKLDPAALKTSVERYLMRQTKMATASGHDGWPRSGTKHFKRGDVGDMLDFGKGTGSVAMEFLKLCVDNRVDAVLCGHVHQHVDFRIRADGDGGFFYFMDFYTENPLRYRESFDWFYKNPGGFVPVPSGDRRPIHIVVDPDAKAGQTPREVRDDRPDGSVLVSRQLGVPPYRDPLDRASDKAAWWSRHRPLILQTSCLGPIDYHQRVSVVDGVAKKRPIPFQGVRVVSIADDHISRVAYVGIDDIRSGKVPSSD